MTIRSYQTGDEHAQARIYNMSAVHLPAFKPSTPQEIARRYLSADHDSATRYYAIENGAVVGYAAFSSNGRVSYPWCLPGAESHQGPLLETMLAAMRDRGLPEAWAAYRDDWVPVLDFLRGRGFHDKRTMVNYLAEVSRLPAPDRLPANRLIEPLKQEELPRLIELGRDLFGDVTSQELERFYWSNMFYRFAESLFALKEAESHQILGVFLLVVDNRFADPTKIDAAMPCFRLGAFGTERERHKRVTGLFSCVFADPADAGLLLSAALGLATRHSQLTHIAAQAPSDAVALCGWYDQFFRRQGVFPILSRRLTN
jgi:hypothetical protein